MTHTRPQDATSLRGADATPRWRSAPHRDGVAMLLAPRLGCTPVTVEHQLREVNQRAAALLTGLLDCNAVDRAVHFYAPIRAAMERLRPRPVRDVLVPAQQADAYEEPVETAYVLHPCRETRRAFITRTERQLITTLELLVALRHEDDTEAQA